jgi:hypothetical protein
MQTDHAFGVSTDFISIVDEVDPTNIQNTPMRTLRIGDHSSGHAKVNGETEELVMHRLICSVAFAASIIAGLCTAAKAAPAGLDLVAAKTIERSAARVNWRYHHVRGRYRPRVYGYYIDYYRPLVRQYYSYSTRIYGWKSCWGCR